MKKLMLFLPVFSLIMLGGCKDEEVTRQPISVNFSSAQFGIDADDNSENIILTLSRKAESSFNVEISMVPNGVIYGTDFTTNPAASANKLTVVVEAGATTATIAFDRVAGLLLDGDENVELTITTLSGASNIRIGSTNPTTKVVFGSILSESGQMTLEGNGDENYINSVYVDLSASRQTPVSRKSWNLGFWCGDEFRVVLNGAYATAATPSAKTDITAVTQDDADAVGDTYNLNINPMGGTFDESIFDSSNGDMTKTAWAEISDNDDANYVYFVASEPDKAADRSDWYKVKVTRNGHGYRVQYARVNSSTINSVDIPKNADYNFTFLSLENGRVVDVEPQSEKWDIKWSYDAGYATSMGVPMYMFMQDFVTINTWGGVSVATVKAEDIAFDNFTASNISAQVFESDRDAIGDRWRSTGGMGSAYGVKTDYYIVKDPAGNYYKLRFLRGGFGDGTTTDGGTRGRPELEYVLVK